MLSLLPSGETWKPCVCRLVGFRQLVVEVHGHVVAGADHQRRPGHAAVVAPRHHAPLAHPGGPDRGPQGRVETAAVAVEQRRLGEAVVQQRRHARMAVRGAAHARPDAAAPAGATRAGRRRAPARATAAARSAIGPLRHRADPSSARAPSRQRADPARAAAAAGAGRGRPRHADDRDRIAAATIAASRSSAADHVGRHRVDQLAERPQPHAALDGRRSRRRDVDRLVELDHADRAEHAHVAHAGQRASRLEARSQAVLDRRHARAPVVRRRADRARPARPRTRAGWP